MADTILGNFLDIECSDCGKIGNVIYQHWGPLVPTGITGFFCKECMQIRIDFSKKNGYARPMLTIKELEFRQMNGDERKKKIAEIKEKLKKYKKYMDPHFLFSPMNNRVEEVDATVNFRQETPENMEFLLMEIDRLNSVLDIMLQK